jgi:Leucine-rich repeat (LRR) protein
MEAEVIPTSRKLHCYEMLSLQYLQDHEVALWQELCHYLMGTPTTCRKRRTQELKADSECQDDYDIEVIPEQSNAEDIFVPSYKVPAIPIQLWPSIKRKLPNFCFDEETWYLFVLLKRNPFRLQKFIDKKSRTDCDFDHRNLLSSYLSTYNFTELHLDCLYRGPGDIIPLPKEIFTFCVNVKLLSLKNNYLESLPADIGRMSNLQKLYLTNNRLQNRGIPYTLQFLKKLNELYLDNNLLDALPSFLLAMKSLHTVHRHGNHNYFKSTFMW